MQLLLNRSYYCPDDSYETIPQLLDLFPHGCSCRCNSLWAHTVQNILRMCVKWCQVKNPFPSIKLSFISACFSPCSSIFGRQFPTVPHFLCFLCFPLSLLLALPLTQSIQPIASYLLRLFRMAFLFSFCLGFF